MIEIKPGKIKDTTVSVPGSKSYTHRMLIAAALSDGGCNIKNYLRSEDTLLTLSCLRQIGIEIREEASDVIIQGTRGQFKPADHPIALGNSGTSMRLLTAVVALGQGPYILTGTGRMQQRPIQDLLDSLNQMGIGARSLNNDGCPPVEVTGTKIKGGKINIDCHISSQFLSALLLIAPFAAEPVEISVTGGPVSKPYIDMTLDVMQSFGLNVNRSGYSRFEIVNDQKYRAGDFAVAPDYSQAGYFWAAAAITGSSIKVKGTSIDSRQGDIRFTDCLKMMGCDVRDDIEGIQVVGRPLTAISVDMADMPDMVPTLAVVAAFAEGTTVIENVAHLKAKESDRLSAVAKELTKMDIEAVCSKTGLIIKGGKPKGAVIDTYDDHRIAMSFALAGLKTPGTRINDEMCVKKSFPNFWEVFGQLHK
jgi:3-phosphoshikimate 1-carboxyvinyltransferase